MMISPDTYYEYNLKGKNLNQVMTAIRGLKKEIGRLKNCLERTFNDFPKIDIYTLNPSLETQLYWTREYLKIAKKTFTELGGEYTFSKMETRVNIFNENISKINKIIFEIGGFPEGFKKYEINFETKLSFEKKEFLEKISELHMGEWKRKYYNSEILDGTQWSIEIYYIHSIKPVIFSGSNNFPYNFEIFKSLFKD